MSEKLPINPDILKWARETAGMRLADVARKMGKTVEMIASWERGEHTPTYIQLEKLAYKVYKRPIALFFFPEPPKEETPRQAFRTLPEHEIEMMSSRMHYLVKQALTMQINLAELNDGIDPAKPNIARELKFLPDFSAETMATRVRNYLKIDLDTQFGWKKIDIALDTWRKTLEECGVFVFKESFQDEAISAFCLHDEHFPLIYLNNNTSKSRQIFSLFHELAHLLLGTGGIHTRNDDYIDHLVGDNKRIEILCNRFAGAFLVPDADFSNRIANIPLNEDSIADLAYRYKVSREVILRKFLDKKLINKNEYNKKTGKWIEEAKEAREKQKTSGKWRLSRINLAC